MGNTCPETPPYDELPPDNDWPELDVDWPQEELGDDDIGDIPVTPWSQMPQDQRDTFQRAMHIFGQHFPEGEALLQDGIDQGSVNVVELDLPPNAEIDDGSGGGAYDAEPFGPTLGIDIDGGYTDSELASIIAHEFHHILQTVYSGQGQYSTNRSNPLKPCYEAGALSAELAFLCDLSCDISSDENVTCSFWKGLVESLEDKLQKCGEVEETDDCSNLPAPDDWTVTNNCILDEEGEPDCLCTIDEAVAPPDDE